MSGETGKASNLNSVFTSNLPDIFRKLNISLIVSTYQRGKVILVRSDGQVMNTHFRDFSRPMGIAVKPGRISIGCNKTIENYQNVPALIKRLDNPEKYDACYINRFTLETGNIDIHEMAWGQNNSLWFVNTRFSCLSTLDTEFSFVPQWRPHFISGLSPEDRCHLNGLAMKNGNPKFVTALGKTNKEGGWRENKRDGGILMDVDLNKILADHLSMPHSPRWYNNQLWMLESGYGTLVAFDKNYNKRVVAKMPGFTRGMDFAGALAFIGLSKVRETATFSDFPLLEELEERISGVYVVHIQTGQIIGFIRFEGDVEEIFAVQVIHNSVFPELLEKDNKLLETNYILPDEALKDIELITNKKK
jgi:uncharacterized protein (TIGR03032 family)